MEAYLYMDRKMYPGRPYDAINESTEVDTASDGRCFCTKYSYPILHEEREQAKIAMEQSSLSFLETK
jgi:hypothetical protein